MADASWLGYFAGAGFVLKGVMLLLAGASVASWACIFQQAGDFRRLREASRHFEKKFWSGGELGNLYADSLRQTPSPRGTEAVFQAGFREVLRLQKTPGLRTENILCSAERAMRGARLQEQEAMEWHLPFLATVGSAAPFVGIFGTVCGIMLTFRTLAHVEQATISMVAPGIAEALIATAMGLFAAIPAVVAYNRFTTTLNRQLNALDGFEDAFVNILQTSVRTHPGER